MIHDVLWRLASVGTTLSLAVSGLLAGPKPIQGPPPCPPDDGISIEDFMMWDGTGGGPAPVPVRAMLACAVPRTLRYETYDITARAGDDYVGVTYGTFVFPANTTSAQLVIHILGDNKYEGTETFGVRLLDGAEFDDPVAIVTLKDP